MEELINNRHFYLYAKHWYKKSDSIFEDLKILLANYYDVESNFFDFQDVASFLLSIIIKYKDHIFLFENSIIYGLSSLRSQDNIKDFKDFYLKNMLSVIANIPKTKILEIEKGILGEPDENILELNTSVKISNNQEILK